MERLTLADLPGRDNFQDVTNIFVEAAADMEPGGLLLRDGFTLMDAMSAFEIGEPRLDSGMAGDAAERPPFDAWAPLLPEEICWIIDRAFSCEMLWHAGNTLAHSVFTCLFALVISDLHPDMLPYGLNHDASRPTQLVPVVLRASICGLLKCCDLSWRELSKGHVHDTEDWQSDKGETSLLEGMSVQNVIAAIDGATAWILRSRKVPEPWATALVARLNLRKALLQIMDNNIFGPPSHFLDLINIARNHLRTVQSYPSPDPSPESAAHLAFDPYIARKLNSTVPIRVIDVPPVTQTWDAIDALLDGWEELRLLSLTYNVSTWELAGNLRVWLPDPPLRAPYIRSSTQSVFYDGLLVLNKYNPAWLVDRFFFETLGVSFQSVVHFVDRYPQSQRSPPWAEIQRGHFKLMTEYIRALWFNPCRRRRYFMKSLVDLHAYYARLTDVVSNFSDLPSTNIMKHIPTCALLWRLNVIREVVLSGFQLGLYTSEEKPFAYWYASQVIDAHLACLDDMLLAVEPDSPAGRESRFQHSLLTALQAMTIPMFALSMPLMSFAWRQMYANFLRRYKWAFSQSYDLSVPVVAPPDFDNFTHVCGRMLQDKTFSPSQSFSLAHSILVQSIESRSVGGYAGLWTNDRIQLLRNLADACERLHSVPSSMAEIPSFDVGLLKWDPQVHPWFPVLDPEGAERRRNVHVRRAEPYSS